MSETHSLVDPRFSKGERQPGLDLLRALAIVLVVFFHAGIFGFSLPNDWQRFGWIGVDLFFVLSGYLIGGQLLASLARGKPLDFSHFFLSRALRILPPYLVILALYFLFPDLREYKGISPFWEFAVFAQNIGLHGGTAFSHAWSLCVEAQFYLLLPFLLILIVPLRSGGLLAGAGVFLGGVILRGLIGHAYLVDAKVAPDAFQTWIYYATWTRLDPLVFGVSLATIQQFRPEWWTKLMRQARWLGLPGVAAIVFGLRLGEEGHTMAATIWQFPLVALGWAMFLACAISEKLPFQKFRVPGARFIASVAYSVYLSHKLVIHQMAGFCSAWHLEITSPMAILLNLLAIFVIGSALFFAVERPFLLLRHRLVKKLT